MFRFRFRMLVCTISIAGASLNAAHADEDDVLICSPEAQPAALSTGAIDSISGALTIPVRVYAEAAEPIDGVDDYRGDEGFFSVSDAGLLPPGFVPPPAQADIRFDFVTFAIGGQSANLWYWNPAAQPTMQFAPASGGQSLSLRKSPTQFFNATVTGADLDVPGFVIDRTSSAGALHKHLTIVIDDADTDLGTPVPMGVYVAALQLSHSGGAAELIIEVINGGMGSAGDAATDQAVTFFESLLSPCPADVNGNGAVDLSDLALLLANFGTLSGATPDNGDLDADGDVDLSDLAALLSAFGTTC